MTGKVCVLAAALAGVAFGEAPYAFRQRLATVHRTDRRDMSLAAEADEYEFPNGGQIVIADDAPELVRCAAEDFREYLTLSMGVNASVRTASQETRPGLVASLSVTTGRKGERTYSTETTDAGISISATDARMAAQALYRLEDRMNVRRGPFVKKGVETRSPLFAHRFTFSGYGDDIFPDEHLNQIAHHGFTGIEIWLDDYDVISQGVRQDVNDLVERAARYGLEGAEPVRLDREAVEALGVRLHAAPIAGEQSGFARHDSRALADALLRLYCEESPTRLYGR